MVSTFRLVRTNRNERTTSKRTPQFSVGISEKWPYHLPSIRNFGNFPSNGKHPRSSSHTSMPLSGFFFQLPAWKTTSSLFFFFWVTVDREYAREESGEAARAEARAKTNCPPALQSLLLFTINLHDSTRSLRARVALRQFWGKKDDRLRSTYVPIMQWEIFFFNCSQLHFSPFVKN